MAQICDVPTGVVVGGEDYSTTGDVKLEMTVDEKLTAVPGSHDSPRLPSCVTGHALADVKPGLTASEIYPAISVFGGMIEETKVQVDNVSQISVILDLPLCQRGMTTWSSSVSAPDDAPEIKVEGDLNIEIVKDTTEIISDLPVRLSDPTDNSVDADSNLVVKAISKGMSDVPASGEPPDVCLREDQTKKPVRVGSGKAKSGKRFHCSLCQKSFWKRYLLNVHMRIHTGERPYPCSLCGKTFISRAPRTAHMRSHRKTRYSCTICDKSFSRQQELNDHTRMHTGETPYKCPQCDQAFASSRLLRVHKKSHTAIQNGTLPQTTHEAAVKKKRKDECEKPFQCTVCLKSFVRSHSLRVHQRLHTGEKPYSCSQCDEKFVSSARRLCHMMKIHKIKGKGNHVQPTVNGAINKTLLSFNNTPLETPGVTKILCSQSGAGKSQASNKLVTRYQCSLCKRSYSRLSDLKLHQRSHTGYKPYKCSLCDLTFISASELRYHSTSKHLAPGKRFQCHLCSKSFTRDSYLKVHIRYHTGDRPYKCDICAESFVSAQMCRSHNIRVHLEPGRRYQCNMCPKSYSTGKDLKAHIRRIHPGLNHSAFDKSSEFYQNSGRLQQHNLHIYNEAKGHNVVHDIYTDETIMNPVLDKFTYNGTPRLNSDTSMDTDVVLLENNNEKDFSLPSSGVTISLREDNSHVREIVTHNSAISSIDKNPPVFTRESVSPLGNFDTAVDTIATGLDISFGKSKVRTNFVEASSENKAPLSVAMDDGSVMMDATLSARTTAEDVSVSTPSMDISRLRAKPVYQNDLPGNDLPPCNMERTASPPRHFVANNTPQKCNSLLPSNLDDLEYDNEMSSDSNSVDSLHKPYKCSVCMTSLSSLQHLKIHLKSHTGDQGYQCTVCSKRFSSSYRLKIHADLHTEISRNYLCTYCGLSYSRDCDLKRHLKTHTKETDAISTMPSQCTICTKTYNRDVDLQVHMKLHSSDTTYPCAHCDKVFLYPSRYRLHAMRHHAEDIDSNGSVYGNKSKAAEPRTKAIVSDHGHSHYKQSNKGCSPEVSLPVSADGHSGRRPFPCKHCDRTFLSQSLMRSHSLNAHVSHRHQCNVCSKSFLRYTSLKVHLMIHRGDRPYSCKDCHKSFANRTVLLSHYKYMHRTAGKRHRCHLCTKTFRSAADLKGHINAHSGQLDFPCDKCSKAFARASLLQKHCKYTHMDPNNFHVCPLCGKSYKKASGLKVHLITHSGKLPFPCTDCDKAFASAELVRKHHKNMHINSGKLHKCHLCTKTYRKAADLKSHINIHNGQLDFPCEKCDKAFASASLLRLHRNYTHMDPDHYHICHICGKSYKKAADLKGHLVMHSGELPFPCTDCDKSFVSAELMRKHHKHAHIDPDKLHRCHLCTKSFRRAAHLKVHIRIHNGDLPFPCTVCGKGFASASHLHKHNKYMHSVQRKHQCHLCTKSYRKAADLKVHIMIHNGDLPFPCKECGQSYASSSLLRKHHIYMHAEPGKRHHCHLCPKSYRKMADLKQHMEVHAGDNPYFCVPCNQSLANMTAFTQHNKDFHTDAVNGGTVAHVDSNRTDAVNGGTVAHVGSNRTDAVNGGTLAHVDSNRTDAVNGGTVAHVGSNRTDDMPSPPVTTEDKEKRFMCDQCPKSYTRKGELKIHKRQHTGEKPFTCDVCEKKFVSSSSLANHKRRIHNRNKSVTAFTTITQGSNKAHTDAVNSRTIAHGASSRTDDSKSPRVTAGEKEKRFMCDQCPKSYKHNSDLTIHKRHHAGEKPFTCDDCEKTFVSTGCLASHRRRMHSFGKRPFTCTECPMKFLTNGERKKHSMVHSGLKPYKCEMCDKAFTQKALLKVHMRHHTGEKPFSCTMCRKTYMTYPGLYLHLRTHSGERPFECEVCGKTFPMKQRLLSHMKIHTGEKDYLCNICGRRFREYSGFRNHSNAHAGVRPYQCTLCEKSYPNTQSLRLHTRTHTGERPYECQECGKTFNNVNNLRQHQVVHTGAKPHECKLCGRRYTQGHSLKTHMRTQH